MPIATPVTISSPLNTFEAAKYLGMCAHTLRTLVAAHQIPCYQVGRYMKFRQSDLDAWVAKQQRKFA